MYRLIAIISLVAAVTALALWPGQTVLSRVIGRITSSTATPPANSADMVERTPQQTLIDELVQAGWDRPAAVTFTALCDEAKLIPTILGRAELSATLRAHPPTASDIHREHPECLPLLARLHHPLHLMQALRAVPQSGQRQMLLSSCLHFRETQQLDLWVAALARHAPWVSRVLEDHKMQDIVPLLCFDRNSDEDVKRAADIYDTWLSGLVSQADGSLKEGNELQTRLAFIHTSGASLRQALTDSAALREQFPRLWPELHNTLEAHSKGESDGVTAWMLASGRPGLWRFILRPEAMRLFRAHGVLAVEWLDGEGAVHPELADIMVRALQDYRFVAGAGMTRYGDNADFRIVCRQLDSATLEKACYYLLESNGRFDVATRVAEWRKNTTFLHDDLNENVGWWPGADISHAAGKALSGRMPTDAEIGWALYDIYDTGKLMVEVAVLLTGNPAPLAEGMTQRAVRKSGTDIAKGLVKKLGKEAAEIVAASIINLAVEAAWNDFFGNDARSAIPTYGAKVANAQTAFVPHTQRTPTGDEITTLEITRCTFKPSPGTSHADLRASILSTAQAAGAAPTDYRAWQRHYLAAQLYLLALSNTPSR